MRHREAIMSPKPHGVSGFELRPSGTRVGARLHAPKYAYNPIQSTKILSENTHTYTQVTYRLTRAPSE